MSLEKRQWERLQEHSTVFIETFSCGDRPGGLDTIVICSSVEVSARGMRVVLDDALEPGAILQLCVELPEPGNPLYLVGEVRWCERNPGKETHYSVGFEVLESDGTDYQTWNALISTAH